MSASYTRVFLNYLIQDKDVQAKSWFDSATDELDSFRKRDKLSLTGPQKKTLSEITAILEAFKNDQIKTAISRAKSVNSDFDKNIEPYLKEDAYKRRSDDQNSSQTQQHYGRHDDGQPINDNHRSGYLKQSHYDIHGRGQGNADNSLPNRDRLDVGLNHNGQNAGTYPDRPANRARIEPVNPEADLEYRSRMAGQRMRHNNPDIADLSDVNRPTKVAERFSELYDNEWTEAFEALVKSKSMKDEQKVIQLLLDIVETAYIFCKKEAEQQIDEMRDKILHILTGGMVQNPQTVPGSDTLLIQFRKSIANTAVDRVVQVFRDSKLPEIFKTRGMNPPKKGGHVDAYTSKAVELTWWMCVQDPPIYMCMHDERIEPSTYPTLYKAYTRSGKIKDYSVWPALKLHQDGGVLVKGVMQFK